ncbi:unnamed protein product [Rotaria magnacalcarata]
MNSFIFLIVAIIIPAYFAQATDAATKNPALSFQYDVFRLSANTGPCETYKEKPIKDPDLDEYYDDFENVACQRYKYAVECYNYFYPTLDENNPNEHATKTDLAKYDLTSI